MSWIIGVDEAGYGPNLGPLVMSAVAYDVSADAAERCMWQTFRAAVRRAGDDADDRLVVDDSKRVYSSGKGLAELERSVCGILLCQDGSLAAESLCALLDRFSAGAGAELGSECWFRGRTTLPMEATLDAVLAAGARFAGVLGESETKRLIVRCDVVCPQRFNDCIERWDSKAAILALGLADFVRYYRQTLTDGEALHFFVDKHGGRNHYGALLQHAIDDGMVLAEQEGARRSFYRVFGSKDEITFTIQPEADASHFCVALASMLCKYVREALMREFNAFWQQHIPGLKATAGYPSDAGRFYGEIRGAMEKMGLAEDAIWRRR